MDSHYMKLSFFKFYAIAMLASLCCACDSKTIEQPLAMAEQPMLAPPLNPGQVLDMGTEYGKKWPGKPALFKLSDTVLLQIPPMYQQFWNQGDKVTRPPADLSKLPSGGLIGFEFFMPGFSGYTPENYKNEFDENKVQVRYLKYVGLASDVPGEPDFFPPRSFRNISAPPSLIDSEKYEEKFGLKCYEAPIGNKEKQFCYGLRDAARGEYILLDIMTPPYAPVWVNPLMRARYFTPQYGGMEILWWANMKHFPRWHDIDSQIWKFIDTWNISRSGNESKR